MSGEVNGVLDADEYETLDEALAAAMEQVGDGGIVTIHAEDCEIEDDEDSCTCEPMTLVRGAAA